MSTSQPRPPDPESSRPPRLAQAGCHPDGRGLRPRVGAVTTVCVLTSALLVVMGPRAASAAPLNDCHSSDNGDPKLTSIDLSPLDVDVSSAPAKVDITATAEDTGGPGAPSGVRSVTVEMPDLSTGGFTEVQLTRDPATGVWAGSLTIPQGARERRLRVSQAFVHDRAGQLAWYGPEDLQLSDVPGTHVITVHSLVDATPPRLTAFSFTPGSVNTTRHQRRVIVSARLHDPETGLQGASAWFTGPHGGHDRFATLHPVPGAKDLVRGSVVMGRYLPSGLWRVAGVGAINGAGRIGLYSYRELGRLGFERDLHVLSSRDRWAPTLHRLQRTPAAVDVRAQNQLVTVTARLEDRGAGIRWVAVDLTNRSGASTSLHLVSGGRHDGTWQGQVAVSRCRAIAGAWKMTVSAMDRRGNYVFFGPRELARRGLPSTVVVTADAPATPPRVKVARYTIASTGRVQLVFARPVGGIDTTSAVVEDASSEEPVVLGTPLAGTWTCHRDTGVLVSCDSGPVITASFRPDSPFVADRDYLVELNPEHTLQITDDQGNPYDREVLFFHVG